MAKPADFGKGLEGLLEQYNIPMSEYQSWGDITNKYAWTPEQVQNVFRDYNLSHGTSYNPTSYFSTKQGDPSFTGGPGGTLAPTHTPDPYWSPGLSDVGNYVGAQMDINTVGALAGYAGNLPGNPTNPPLGSHPAQSQVDPYLAARQAAINGAMGGYTPTQNPGINPITGAGLGAASGVASGASQAASGVPGLVLPANQPGNNFFAQDIGMAGPQGAAGSQAGVLNLYADLYGQGMNAVSQYGQAELGQLQNTYLQNSAAMQSQLRGAGLNNTTVGQSMQTGLSQSKDLALTNLNEQIGQYQTGVIGSLGTGVANAAASLYGQQQGINAQATANQQNINANFVNSQAALNAQAQEQRTQIAGNAAQAQNQFNYATALASQQYGYNSNLQQQNLGLQNQYQRQLLQLQASQQKQASEGGMVAGRTAGTAGTL